MPTETMTGRQRVQNAIHHRPVDRVPIDLGVHFSTGISAYAYRALREYLGLDTGNIEMIDCVQQLARVDDDIAARFHVDTVLLNPPWENTWRWEPKPGCRFAVPRTFSPERQPDGGWKCEAEGKTLVMPAGGFFFDGGWPDFYALGEDDKIALFARRAEQLWHETDRFTMQMGFPGYFGGIYFACDMLTDPDDCKARNERQLEESLRRFDRINRAYGRWLGALEINSDLGMQSGPMCRPASYEECCYPYLKRFCAHVHENSDIAIFMHSCGSIEPMLPLVCDAGVDIINPVQISAANMDPHELKRKYGDRLCFWGGGCNTQQVLAAKSPDEVAQNVRELVAAFKPGSGFVFNQVHNIMGNVPPQNIVAMLDTAYECAF